MSAHTLRSLFLVVGFLLLCSLIVASVLNYPVPTSARYLVVMLLAFSASAGGHLIGQKIETKLEYRRARGSLLSVRSAGSAALFVFTILSGYFFYVRPAEKIEDKHVLRQRQIGKEIVLRIRDVEQTLTGLQSNIIHFSKTSFSSLAHLEEERESFRKTFEPAHSRVRVRLAGSLYAGTGYTAQSGAVPGDREFHTVDFGTLVGMWWAADNIRHQVDGGGILGNVAAFLRCLEVPNDPFISDGGGRFAQRVRKDGYRFSDESQEISDRVNRITTNANAVVQLAITYLQKIQSHPDVAPIVATNEHAAKDKP